MFSSDHLAPYLPVLEEANHLYVGYSGGLDSHVLLHTAAQLVGADQVTALHINHQLSANADHWQAHCAEQCRQLGVVLQAFRVDVDASQGGAEQAARDARYRVFEAALEKGDLLLLAHHADDQAETVLYRMLRCSGPRGLAAMPERRAVGSGELLRPLLGVTRSDLAAYAQREALQWIEDESNKLLDYDRNFLRHQVAPVLHQRWPDLAERLSEVSALCRATDDLTREVAEQDLDAAAEREERLGVSISLSALSALSVLRRHNLVRFWLERHGYTMPPKVRLERIHRELIGSREDASPVIEFGDCQLRRFRGRVYLLMPMPDLLDKGCRIPWDGRLALSINGVGQLSAMNELPDGCEVRLRQGGERCQPAGRPRSQALKKLLQEYGLEPWLRERVPLLYRGEELIAVAGLFSCLEGVELRWLPSEGQ